MKVVMLLWVRDEEEIIDYNIKYHKKMGVDFFIAMDNGSVDNTANILKKHEKLGYLKYIYYGDHKYEQEECVLRMYKMAVEEYGADWVIPNDADEFWYHKSGSIKEAIISFVKEHGEDISVFVLIRNNMFINKDRVNSDFLFYRNNIRTRKNRPKTLPNWPGKVIIKNDDKILYIHQGNHGVTFKKGVNGKTANISSADFIIYHYPIRGYINFLNKIVKGITAYRKNPNGYGAENSGISYHKKGWFKQYDKLGIDKFKAEVFDEFVIDEGEANEGLQVDNTIYDIMKEFKEEDMGKVVKNALYFAKKELKLNNIKKMDFDDFGWFSEDKKVVLKRLIDKNKINCVIEVGAFVGKSAFWFKSFDFIRKVFCIDIFKKVDSKFKTLSPGQYSNYRSVFLSNCLHRSNLSKNIWMYEGDSQVGISEVKKAIFKHVPMDSNILIYIDGGHSYGEVKNDILAAMKEFPNAIICGDDYNNGGHPGVTKAVKEVLANNHSHLNNIWWRTKI